MKGILQFSFHAVMAKKCNMFDHSGAEQIIYEISNIRN